MRFFLDTANREEIAQANQWGLIDGVTTNPSLLAKEGGQWRTIAHEICAMVEGPVSLEVIATETEKMLAEARDLVKIAPNVVVKIPMTLAGLQAVRALAEQNIPTNVTLVFSAGQALLAAKAGASYVSPFIGRLDDIGHNGMDLVGQIMNIYANYNFQTQLLVASIRNINHVLESAQLGADVATLPMPVLRQLASHPLTDQGLEKFLADWKTGQDSNG
ncbi:MAG: fructose-6-phosphate aldolase [Thermodesulfobacteriota bacterium]